MAILCDNCKADITPDDDEEISDRNMLDLNGRKVCLCTECFIVLSNWACSDEHRKALKEYQKEFQE